MELINQAITAYKEAQHFRVQENINSLLDCLSKNDIPTIDARLKRVGTDIVAYIDGLRFSMHDPTGSGYPYQLRVSVGDPARSKSGRIFFLEKDFHKLSGLGCLLQEERESFEILGLTQELADARHRRENQETGAETRIGARFLRDIRNNQ